MKATELSLKQELAPILGAGLNAQYVAEATIIGQKRSQLDVSYSINGQRIVLELEVGGHRKLLEGISQADGYREAAQADGTITIVYPEQSRGIIETENDVKRILYDQKFEALVLTPFQRKYYQETSLQAFIDSLRNAVSQPQPTDLDTLLGVLKESVENIAFQIKRGQDIESDLTSEVVSKLELFKVLAGQEKDMNSKTLKKAAADLASYIIVNQLLLYFLLSPTLDLPKLRQIDSVEQLQTSFKLITDVDYHAVYKINVLRILRTSKRSHECIGALNRMIIALKNLKPEGLSHDLLGRMFHELLPLATRKLFATFYTKPVAAEILASLAIDSLPKKVLEPSTGSGTILVSTYNALRKRMIDAHHADVLDRLYAIDIMPFAAHLAALNLTLQDLSSRTENVNVGIGNSLNIRPSAKYPTQVGLFDRMVTRRANAQERIEEQLRLPKSFDLIIMNPPFTDSRRYLPGMLGARENAFVEIQNYWAYFLSLADDMLQPGGRIAAVLPRLFFSGSKSSEVRKWLFHKHNYVLLWVVRTTKEFAFSEAASFRDFLVVLEKRQNETNLPFCRIVYLNRSLSDLRLEEIPSITKDMKLQNIGKGIRRTADFSIFEVSQNQISRNLDFLWSLVGFEHPENSFEISDFIDKLKEYADDNIVTLSKYLGINNIKKEGLGSVLPRGFEPKPKGLYGAIYVSRFRRERPDQPNALHLIEETQTHVVLECKKQRLKIKKEFVFPAVYSASYLRSYFIDSSNCDYVVSGLGPFSKRLHDLSGINIDYTYISKSIEKCKTNILITKRLNIVAPGATHTSFFSHKKMVSPNTFYSVECNKEQALVLCAWMNSVFGILQLLQSRKETEGGYCDLLKEDLALFLVPNIKTLPKEIREVFEKNNSIAFPTMVEQFTDNSVRRELDMAWMKWLGWSASSLDNDIKIIYKSIRTELEALALAGRKHREDSQQTELDTMQTV